MTERDGQESVGRVELEEELEETATGNRVDGLVKGLRVENHAGKLQPAGPEVWKTRGGVRQWDTWRWSGETQTPLGCCWLVSRSFPDSRRRTDRADCSQTGVGVRVGTDPSRRLVRDGPGGRKRADELPSNQNQT